MSKKENWVNIFCSIHDLEMLFLYSFQYKCDNLTLHYKYAGIDFENMFAQKYFGQKLIVLFLRHSYIGYFSILKKRNNSILI